MTERLVPVQDVVALVVPPDLRGRPMDVVTESLEDLARVTTAAQYAAQPGMHGLRALVDFQCEWLITSDPEAVELFQPAHDCARCRAGNERAMAHLREHPDEPVALGNLSYVEVWSD